MDQHGLVPDSSLYFIISRVYVPGLSCEKVRGTDISRYCQLSVKPIDLYHPDCRYIRTEFRWREGSGRLYREMAGLLPPFRHCQLVEYSCQHRQYLHHCHYSEILKEDTRFAHRHYRGDHCGLSDENLWWH